MQSSHLREHNLSTVLRAVAGAETPVSRAALAKRTGLTKPTVSKLVQELLEAGLLVEGQQAAARVSGRPMIPLTVARGTVLGVGLEIAADHLACLVTDLGGRVLHEESRFGAFAGGLRGRGRLRAGRSARGRPVPAPGRAPGRDLRLGARPALHGPRHGALRPQPGLAGRPAGRAAPPAPAVPGSGAHRRQRQHAGRAHGGAAPAG